MTPSEKGKFIRVTPYFPVGDVEKAAHYYETVLGFQREYAAGKPLEFAILARDGQGIMLRSTTMESKIVPNEKQGGTWDAFFWVSDVQALYEELLSKNATLVYAPIVQEYHMKEFAVRDLNGYVLGFGQEWPPQKSGDGK
jgi:uncharacterized glyoxalase superfamily protein PhnB